MRIVLEGLRGEQSVSELCRREGIAANLYTRSSKDLLEAGKKQFAGDTVREAASDGVGDQREVGWRVGSARRRIESRARP
jgi:transposase